MRSTALRDREPLAAAGSQQITVYTNSEPILSHIGSIIEPDDILGAQFSLPFSMAMRLHHGGRGVNGGNGFWDYPRVDLKDPAAGDCARRSKCVVAEGTNGPRSTRAPASRSRRADGRRMREIVPTRKGCRRTR